MVSSGPTKKTEHLLPRGRRGFWDTFPRPRSLKEFVIGRCIPPEPCFFLSQNLPSGFIVLEETKEGLVDALDGLKEFINSNGFASYFVCGGVRDYGVAGLSGAADALSRQ